MVTINTPEAVSAPDARDAGTTDETHSIGNSTFLLAMFDDEFGGVCPVEVSFAGNPSSVPGKALPRRAWQSESGIFPSLPATVNNYFHLATFRLDDAGQLAAAELAWRLEAERRAVEIFMPTVIGHDFADELEAFRDV